MIENVLSSIGGIGIYGIISICIFFGTFCAAAIWMISLKKPYLRNMSELPLEDDRTQTQNTTAQPKDSHE